MGTFSHVKNIIGNEIFKRINKFRILVVGAGGIGCELMKNLVLTGFCNLTILDIDTIDVSNLNRQFFFRKKHVGMYKALVVAEEAQKLSERCWKYEDDHDIEIDINGIVIDIRKYEIEIIKKFDIILNALDNIDARRYVNRLCLKNNIILIDSGSTGYNGQVHPIIPHVTFCYECHPPPVPKSFPICTIRSNPDKPQHCIAWSKYLFEIVFRIRNKTDISHDNMLNDLASHVQYDISNGINENKIDIYIENLFNYLFYDEITELKKSTQLWVDKAAPITLKWDLKNKCVETPSILDEKNVENTFITQNKSKQIIMPEQRVLNLLDSSKLFYKSTKDILTQYFDQICTSNLVFNKDDHLIMDFITSCTNLRCYNFHIPLQSKWTCQSIAGAIIPAVASTNAIVGGLQVCELLRIIKLQIDINSNYKEEHERMLNDEYKNHLKYVWIKNVSMGNYLLLPEKLDDPLKTCLECYQQLIEIQIKDLSIWRLCDFVHQVLYKILGLLEPLIDIDNKCIWDPDFIEDNEYINKTKKTLKEWGIKNGSNLIITDFSQDKFQCDVIITVNPSLEIKDSNTYIGENNGLEYKVTYKNLNNINQGEIKDNNLDENDKNDYKDKDKDKESEDEDELHEIEQINHIKVNHKRNDIDGIKLDRKVKAKIL